VARVLAVTNQKGGVGKTTTSVNLAASLAATKRRVLLIDLDPQGNATMGSGIDKSDLITSIYEVIMGETKISDAVMESPGAYHIIPANGDLTAAEIGLLEMDERELRLKKIVSEISDQYDFIIIDCPPSLNMLTINALVAAHGVIIPVQCEYYALEGLSALIETIQAVNGALNSELEIEGILRTMYDPRSKLTLEVSNQLFSHFGDRVYRTVVPRNIRLAEAPSFGLPILQYDRQSRGAVAYLALAGEMLRRSEQKLNPS
jgi:chromosome partitioning protein